MGDDLIAIAPTGIGSLNSQRSTRKNVPSLEQAARLEIKYRILSSQMTIAPRPKTRTDSLTKICWNSHQTPPSVLIVIIITIIIAITIALLVAILRDFII